MVALKRRWGGRDMKTAVTKEARITCGLKDALYELQQILSVTTFNVYFITSTNIIAPN